jgi:hypothetical protein
MNDTMSLILATSILAIGGLGLYMFKNNTEEYEGGNGNDENDENDEGFFGSNFFGNSEQDEELVEDPDLEDDEDYKPKSKKGGKTKRNKKVGGTKRRY